MTGFGTPDFDFRGVLGPHEVVKVLDPRWTQAIPYMAGGRGEIRRLLVSSAGVSHNDPQSEVLDACD
jgi:hypothetical protein